MYNIQLQGLFRIIDDTGNAVTPRGNKARAIIALLSFANNNRRTRAQLQDKLWSDRAAEQAAGSLRQTLTEIRQALGHKQNLVHSDARTVWLNADIASFDIDTQRIAPFSGQPTGGDIDLLDDIVVRDVEYQNWVAQLQSSWQTGVADTLARVVANKTPVAPPANSKFDINISTAWPGRIVFGGTGASKADSYFSRFLASWAMQSIGDTGFDVVPAGKIGSADGHFQFLVQAASPDGQTGISITILLPDGRMAWCEALTTPKRVIDATTSPAVIRIVYEGVDALLQAIITNLPSQAELKPSMLAALASRKLFSLGGTNFGEAETLLKSAMQNEQRGVYWAWLACLKAMEFVEGPVERRANLPEMTHGYVAKALELEPHNATVLALCGHARNVVNRDFFTGFELSRRAVERAPYNPLALTIHATSNFYLGRYAEADVLARTSCGIASNGPYRYFADTSRLISAALTGNYDEALRLAQVTHSLKPDYLPPLRYLAALSLKSQDFETASATLETIRKRLPGYSLDQMREASASVPGFSQSDFFKFNGRDAE
jgi:tetratricopeptide (TPR) repeat protein